jgi:hypothetical protein
MEMVWWLPMLVDMGLTLFKGSQSTLPQDVLVSLQHQRTRSQRIDDFRISILPHVFRL